MRIEQRGRELQAKLDRLETEQPAGHAELVRTWNISAPLVMAMAYGMVAALTAEAKGDLTEFERVLDAMLAGATYDELRLSVAEAC